MSWTFIATELIAYFWMVLCVRHAWRGGGWRALVTFGAGGLYGFILEYASVRANTDYCYGKFLVMLPWWHVPVPPGDPCAVGPSVPLWIAFGWCCTFYGAKLTAERVSVPWQLRPVIAALVAVSFDFIVDPIAEHLGFWHWYVPGPYFGIPLDNYFGWVLTISSFVLILALCARRWPPATSRFGAIGAPLVAIVVAALMVKLGMTLYAALAKHVAQLVIVGAVYGVGLALVIPARLRVRGTLPPDPVILGMVGSYLVYWIVVLTVTGMYAAHPLLIGSTVGVALAVGYGYGWPYRFTSGPGSGRRGA